MVPSIAFALLLASQTLPAADAACGFTVAPAAGRPEIAGPPDAVSRTSVVAQPDSPLRIVRVDLSEASLGEGAGGSIRFDVQNASNRTVRGGAIAFTWRVGYVSTGGNAAFTNALEPGATMRLDARLPGVKMSGVTATAVAISVRSATFDGCSFEPAQAALLVPDTSVGLADASDEACTFTITAGAGDEPPQVSGAPEVLARLRVVPQAHSPLRIRRLDVSRLKLNIGETWLQVRGTYIVEVQNVSNRPIDSATVALFTRARGPAGGNGPAWPRKLAPGKTMELRQDVSRIADLPPGATADDVQLLAGIDYVTFDRCRYHPARAYVEPQRAPRGSSQ